MTTISTPEDVVKSAMSIATDAAEGTLGPADLERQAVAELTELVGVVVGDGDPLYPLQIDIARQVIAHGGIPTDELAEWLAVQRRREQPDAPTATEAVVAVALVEPAEGPDVPDDAEADVLEPHSAENDAVQADAEPDPAPVDTDPEPAAAPSDHRIVARGRGFPVDNGLRPL